MVTYDMEISAAEHNLIMTTRKLEYGTLDNLEVPDETLLGFHLGVSCQEARLIEAIREGWRCIDRIQVHQGEPAYMEVGLVINGFKGTKRFKFS